MHVEFDWDEEKAASNLRKHGISFATASLAFFDPGAIYEQDRIVDGEERWRVIGTTDEEGLLLVAHLVQDQEGIEVVRIISARGANKWERLRYGKNS